MGDTDLTLEQLDRDGALREAIGRVDDDQGTRAELLRGAAVGSAVFSPRWRSRAVVRRRPLRATARSSTTRSSSSTSSRRSTRRRSERALSAGRRNSASAVLGAVERAHVEALRDVLGSAAVPRPLFNFKGVTEQQTPFLRTAVAFEDLAVAAYKGQATRIQAKPLLVAAVSIHSVEARHAAWMRHLFGITPAANAFDDALSRPQVESIVAKTRFIVSHSRTARSGRSPRLAG